MKDYNLQKTKIGETLLDVPNSLLYDYMIYVCFRCSSKKSNFHKYR